MIARLHNGVAFQVLTPDLSTPVTDRQEVLELARISLDVVDGTVMLALLKTELEVDFDLLALVGLEDITLLSTDEVLERGGIGVVLETSTTEHLGLDNTVDSEVFDEFKLFEGTTLKVSLIPPKKATIGRCGDALGTSLASNPVNIVDWVVVRLLENGGEGSLDGSTGTLVVTTIEEADGTVVRATDDQIAVLLRESHGAEGRSRLKSDFRRVRVVQVPDVRVFGHVGGGLLEAELGVGSTDTQLTGLRVPRDLSDRALDGVGVLEDHNGLSGDGLRHELGVLAVEVLFKEIDFVVLLDATCGAHDELTGGLAEAKSWLLVELPHVLVDFVLLLVVILLRPTTDRVVHTSVLGGNSFSVNLLAKIGRS